ncbi:MAG: cupredoxin domain-containing protein, partial [Deltaproteobacteria bacterium]|nr:cupredoxin domain-containing protein [Deltaproteobacteria bacterium]
MMNTRVLMILGLVLAGLCLVRVFSVAASERGGDVEVYSATENGGDDGSDSRSSAADDDHAEIRLSSPEESAARVDNAEGYEQVPGAERQRQRDVAENSLIVPRKVGRKIASAPEGGASQPAQQLEQSPVEVRPEAAPPTAAPLRAEVIEPKPFTAADAKARSSESRGESIVASNKPLGRPAFGIHSEPEPETRVEPPVPASAMASRAGVQELSVIVSDYGYFPNRIFVTQNVPVKIYLSTPSKATMCFMLDTWSVKKGVLPGKVEEVSFTPDTPGDYRFYCPVKSIEGKITVREAPTAQPAARG